MRGSILFTETSFIEIPLTETFLIAGATPAPSSQRLQARERRAVRRAHDRREQRRTDREHAD